MDSSTVADKDASVAAPSDDKPAEDPPEAKMTEETEDKPTGEDKPTQESPEGKHAEEVSDENCADNKM